MIKNQKMIGIKFYPDKLIQGLIKSLPNPKWSQEYNMAYIPNTKANHDKHHDHCEGEGHNNMAGRCKEERDHAEHVRE